MVGMTAYPVVHHPDYVAPLPAGHRFPMSKYEAVVAALSADDTAGLFAWHDAPALDRDTVARAHEAAYVDQVFRLAVPADMERRIGFPVTQRVLTRARHASGGTLAAARLALALGVASNTAGGSHHAHPGFGAGFCVFNDVGIAARTLLDDGAVARVLVVDLDVHQGDGTAAMFAAEPRVFTFSMHCEANFPVRKAVSDLDIGLPPGTGDQAYLDRLAEALPTLLSRHRPNLVFYNAGVDVHAADRLGRLALSDAGIAARDRLVAETVLAAEVPLCTVMGGGYSDDVGAVAARHAATIRAIADCWRTRQAGE